MFYLFILGIDFNPIASIIVYGDSHPSINKMMGFFGKGTQNSIKLKEKSTFFVERWLNIAYTVIQYSTLRFMF